MSIITALESLAPALNYSEVYARHPPRSRNGARIAVRGPTSLRLPCLALPPRPPLRLRLSRCFTRVAPARRLPAVHDGDPRGGVLDGTLVWQV